MNFLRITSQGASGPFSLYKGSFKKVQIVGDKGERFVNQAYTAKSVFDLQFPQYNAIIHHLQDRKDEDGVFGGKIFEYFGASRPILALGRDSQNVVRTILHETKTGEYFSSTEVLKEALCRWYEEWKLTGSVSYHGDDEEINKYSYRAMAGKFAELLDSLS